MTRCLCTTAILLSAVCPRLTNATAEDKVAVRKQPVPPAKAKPADARLSQYEREYWKLIRRSIAGKPQQQFRIEFKLVELKEHSDATELEIRLHPYRLGSRSFWNGHGHTFTNLQCVNCHSLPKGAKPSDDSWKAAGSRLALATWVGKSKGVKVLAEPELVVTKGRKAVMSLKSPRKIEYFERQKGGLFALKHEMVETGISITATVQEAKDGNVRMNPLSVSVAAIKSREDIPGVSLPVGKPVLTTTSISTSLLSKLGKSSVISIDSPRGGRILVSVRISPVSEADILFQWLRSGTDATFIRRMYLDVKGVPPTAAEVRKFLDDKSPDKRRRLLKKLLEK